MRIRRRGPTKAAGKLETRNPKSESRAMDTTNEPRMDVSQSGHSLVWTPLVLGGLFLASAVSAQVPAEGEGEALRETMSLGEILSTGGWPMYVLGVMSVVGLALTLYFFLVLRASQLMPPRFVNLLLDHLKSGRLGEARNLCEGHRCAAAAVARSAVDYALGTEDPDPGMIKEVIEGEGGRQAIQLRDQVQHLHDISVIAPMVGLLGTVMGMLTAFNSVALDIAKAKPMVLAAGVSQALITTAAGLIVGIPAMMAYAFFRGRASRLISVLETVSADLHAALVRGRSS